MKFARLFASACFAFLLSSSLSSATMSLDTSMIEKETGLKGSMQDGGVFQVTYPRKDLHPVINGIHLVPPMGLTAWASFQSAGRHTMVMGDVVMTEEQVNPVMDAALENGLEVTALHNHFFWDSPKIMFMHIGGMGNADTLARAVGKVFHVLKETSENKPQVATVTLDTAENKIDLKVIDSIMHHTGKLNGGVYKVTVGRETTMSGVKVGNPMGVNTWAAFAGADDKAVVDGDFAMLESELQTVLKMLRRHDLQIVAIHNHMVGEQPRFVFLHYWGVARAVDLAAGVRAALDAQRIQ